MSNWQDLRDALGLKLRPIDQWPGKSRRSRRPSPFSAPLKDTLAVLRRELRELGARSIVLQIALREKDLRQDGLPRAQAVAEHPGVILAFESKYGPMRLFHDGFTRWDHNLRAIVKHLEDLRHASLYGVGEDGQQYRGWMALPAGGETPTTLEVAARVVTEFSSESAAAVIGSQSACERAYRETVRRVHPDQGGSHEGFLRLQSAIETLRRYHAGTAV